MRKQTDIFAMLPLDVISAADFASMFSKFILGESTVIQNILHLSTSDALISSGIQFIAKIKWEKLYPT